MPKSRLIMLASAAVLALAAPAAAHAAGTIAYQQLDADFLPQLWTVAADGSSGPVQLTTQADGNAGCDPEGCFAEAAEWSPDGSRIWFDAFWTGLPQLWSMKADGSDKRRELATDDFNGYPGLAPDGSFVAYDHDDGGFDPRLRGIYRADLSGGTPVRLTHGPVKGYDTSPEVSPDSQWIAFMRVLPKDCSKSDCRYATVFSSIWVMRANGSQQRRITGWAKNWSDPQWSPDGSRLLIQSYDDGSIRSPGSNQWTIRPDGALLRQLTHSKHGDHSYSGDWSPDGAQIVFGHYTDGDDFVTVRVANLDGTGARDLVTCDVFCDNPTWSP